MWNVDYKKVTDAMLAHIGSEPHFVSKEDYNTLYYRVGEFVNAVSMANHKLLIIAVSSGDYDFGGMPDEKTEAQWLELKQKINKSDFYEASGIIQKYWR
jgi:hypothetical protein